VPYRSVGPVTVEEYESRAERYDGQLQEQLGLAVAGMSTAEKMKALRDHREEQYEKLIDAVYAAAGLDRRRHPQTGNPAGLRHRFAGSCCGG
jgi:aldehyde:ferredoxin oxidoreductase